MPQKWNLGDIRPRKPEQQGEGSGGVPVRAEQAPGRPRGDIAPRRPQPVTRPPQTRPPEIDEDLGTLDIIDGNKAKRGRTILVLIVAVLIIGGALLLNVLMGGAEVTVYPKFKDVSVQATFEGKKEPKSGELGYELLTLEATGERQVKASGTEKVSERAEGTLFIYNTETKGARLIKNTRFENPDGLIFKIKESVEIPSATKDAKGALVPGVVSADVFADGTGEQYNVPPARFTVPGLKGSPQFATVYGESNVSMTGGFEGERFLLDENELELRKQELQQELRASLLERLKTERPVGFVVFESSVAFSFETLPATTYGDSLATIKEKAYLHVPLFKEDEFASYIADSTIAGYEGEKVELPNAQTLSFTYESATATVSDISTETTLPFTLKGTTRVVWSFDTEKLKKDLLGLSKTALEPMLQSYPAIDRAEAVVRPFWAQSFPESPEEIKVETILGETKE